MSSHQDIILSTDRKEDPQGAIDTTLAVEGGTSRGAHRTPTVGESEVCQ